MTAIQGPEQQMLAQVLSVGGSTVKGKKACALPAFIPLATWSISRDNRPFEFLRGVTRETRPHTL